MVHSLAHRFFNMSLPDAVAMCERSCVAKDCRVGQTTYQFADGSEVMVSYSEVKASQQVDDDLFGDSIFIARQYEHVSINN